MKPQRPQRKSVLKTANCSFEKRIAAFFVLACLTSGWFLSLDALAKKPPLSKEPIPSSSVEKRLYSDVENGYSIEFPATWDTKKDMIVSLVAAPKETFKMPNPIPNVKIVVKSIPDGHTIDTISDTAIRQWSSIWKIESDERSKAGKTPTRRLVLIQSIPVSIDTSAPFVHQTKVLKAFAASKDKYYIVSCATYEDNFEKSRQMFTEIIDSLTLTQP